MNADSGRDRLFCRSADLRWSEWRRRIVGEEDVDLVGLLMTDIVKIGEMVGRRGTG